LIRERKAAEDESESEADSDETTKDTNSDEASSGDARPTDGDTADVSEDASGQGSDPDASTSEDATKPYTEAERKPTPQREEAILILADLVELQESVGSSWHVPQSASRSEPPSSQP
jgi:hypothetical protein